MTGRPLLVEDVDEPGFDETVSQLAGKVRLKQGVWRVTVGDKEVPVADGFRLYVTTRLVRPLLTHETLSLASISVIDFTLTDDAVTEQLLNCVFQHDKPVSSIAVLSHLPSFIQLQLSSALIFSHTYTVRSRLCYSVTSVVCRCGMYRG